MDTEAHLTVYRGATHKKCPNPVCCHVMGNASKACPKCGGKMPYKDRLQKAKEKIDEAWKNRQFNNRSVNKLYDSTNLMLYKWQKLGMYPLLILGTKKDKIVGDIFFPVELTTDQELESLHLLKRIYEGLIEVIEKRTQTNTADSPPLSPPVCPPVCPPVPPPVCSTVCPPVPPQVCPSVPLSVTLKSPSDAVDGPPNSPPPSAPLQKGKRRMSARVCPTATVHSNCHRRPPDSPRPTGKRSRLYKRQDPPHSPATMSEPKSTESLGSGSGSPAQKSTQRGPEMVAVKLEDCSQTLELNVVVKEEEGGGGGGGGEEVVEKDMMVKEEEEEDGLMVKEEEEEEEEDGVMVKEEEGGEEDVMVKARRGCSF